MKFTDWETEFLRQIFSEELRYGEESEDPEQLTKVQALITKLELGAVCPLCGEVYFNYPALSRIDNETNICPNCGLREATRPQTTDSFRELWSESKSMPASIEKALDERERAELAQ